jgi:hypothetical protein
MHIGSAYPQMVMCSADHRRATKALAWQKAD